MGRQGKGDHEYIPYQRSVSQLGKGKAAEGSVSQPESQPTLEASRNRWGPITQPNQPPRPPPATNQWGTQWGIPHPLGAKAKQKPRIDKGKFKGHAKGKGTPPTQPKGKGKDTNNDIRKQGIVEHHGVMIMYKKDLEKSRKWFKQIDGRNLQICFKTKGPDLVITNTLAPHTWASGDITKEDALEIRQDYFQSFTETLLDFKENKLHLVVGDLNTRLHARMEGEEEVLGKHIFGRGVEFVKKLPQADKEQRELTND